MSHHTTQPTHEVTWDDLGNDLQSEIFQLARSDTRGNITVPGFAAACGLRAVSKATQKVYANTATSYDATVEYQANTYWPVRFGGGLGFGNPHQSMRFFIVHDPCNGRVFACTVDDGQSCSGFRTVCRVWPLARLSRLLNGHCTVWNKRLEDLDAVALGEMLFVKHNQLSPSTRVVPPIWYPQVVTESRVGDDWAQTSSAKHERDYIAHKVTPVPDFPRTYVKDTTLVVSSMHDRRNGHTVVELSPTLTSPPDVFRNDAVSTSRRVPPIHVLSIALGWFDEGSVVQRHSGESLYCHGREKFGIETHYKRPPSTSSSAHYQRRLMRMAHIATALYEKRRLARFHGAEQTNSAPSKTPNASVSTKRQSPRAFGPAMSVALQPRRAAQRAKEMIIDHVRHDNSVNSKGRLNCTLQPKHTRRAAAMVHGEVDAQYAEPGERAPIEYNSDVEFEPKKKRNKLSRSERVAINFEREVREERQRWSELLAPSDCEDDE